MVTIKDVARAAGVSVATVSRVWNDSAAVTEPTRERVRTAAAELGYAPHGAARSLITSRTNTLGVLLPDLFGEFFSEVIRGIDQTAQQHGYHLLVSSSHDSAADIDAALRSMRGRVDGLVVMSPNLDAQRALSPLATAYPAVLLNADVDSGRFDAITIANADGAAAVVRHLAAGLGHRRIAMITGSARNYDAEERLRGYRTAMRDAGLEAGPELLAAGDFTEGSGYRAATTFVALTPRPTAIFAANDSMAIGALSALREHGLRVPDDVAVVGLDDIPLARYMNPPLSTVHVDITELGRLATARLLARLDDAEAPGRRHSVPATLVVRSSCGGDRTSHSNLG